MIARAVMMRAVSLGVALALALAAASCTWFDDGPPSRSCRSDRDCFAAQGEYCNTTSLTCEQRDASAAGGADPEAP